MGGLQIFNDIEIKEALQRDDLLFIDVRSPREFVRAKIPNALNLPLFDDEEHKKLGLINKEQGSSAARLKALEYAGPRLHTMISELIKIRGDKIPLIYCWRGGLRSLSFYQILYLCGIQAVRLKGGYKAYRRHVYSSLQNYCFSAIPIILHGLTGTGKTAIIKKLKEEGYPAIDLEELALHRGSVFGKIGYKDDRSQKDFEGLLWEELNSYRNAPLVFMEKEGKKIGQIILPALITDAMEEGVHILLEAPLQARAERILYQYMEIDSAVMDSELFITAINSIGQYLGKEQVKKLIDLYRKGNYYDVVIVLCRDYYDRLYKDARRGRYEYEAIIDTSCIKEATAKIADIAEKLKKRRRQNNESP